MAATQQNNLPVQDSHTLMDYLNLVRLNFVPIFLISLTGFLVALIYAISAPNIYKSTTVLKLSKPQGSILSGSLIPEFQDFGSDRFIANEIEILKSYHLREKVAESLIDSFKTSSDKSKFSLITEETSNFSKGSRKLRSVQGIVSVLSGKVSVDQKRGLDIIEISVESQSPSEAAMIANCYASAYKDINLSFNREQLTVIKNFLAKQRDEKLFQLAGVEDAFKNFQEKSGIVELPEQARSLIEQSSDFQAKMNAAKVDLTISEKTLNNLKAELNKRDPNLTDYIENLATEPYIRRLQEQIGEQRIQRDRAIASQSPNAQKLVKDADAKISELRDKLNNQLTVFRAGVLASTPEEIKDLTRKVVDEEIKYQSILASFRKLNEIVGDYDRKMSQLPTTATDQARLEREKSANEKLYLQVEERYQEAIINEQSVPGNASIIDAGLISDRPSKPNRLLIVIIGSLMGVGMGIGFAFIKNMFDNTVKTPEDIQNKNIKILSWVPLIEGLETGSNGSEFIVAKKPDASASEAYRTLRTRIKFSKIEKELLKTILITSASAQEGKTTTSINLAGSFAQANFKTLILDADLRKPRIHTVFNQKRFPGFTDYFFGQATYEEIVRKSEINNLDFITAGTIPPNPAEILGSAQMESFLKKLKTVYDYIILDSPPVIAVTDSEILSSMVDGTILVVSAGNTEMELMEKAVELFNNDRSFFLGVILNNFKYRSGYGSYYKYYYYYSHPGNGSKKRMKV